MLPARSWNEEDPLSTGAVHQPVLLRETVQLLQPRPGAILVDGTLGLGGHAEALLAGLLPGGRLIGVDRDPAALAAARLRLSRFGSAFLPIHGDHDDLPALLARNGIDAVDGVLLDLGVSSMQLDDPQRGFSFLRDGPLDMRMDPGRGAPAAEWLARWSEADLRRILRTFGEERRAAAIARAIVRARESGPLTRTTELARIVERVAGPGARRFRIHPATRAFQAIRIAVNQETVALGRTVERAVSALRPGGRVVVIAYHSLEDRPVKQTLQALAHRCVCPPRLPVCGCGRQNVLRLITPRALRPQPEEIERNPRARSARLRAGERL